MSDNDNGIDVARAALARARAHARAAGRSTVRKDTTHTARTWRISVNPDEEVRSGPGSDARDPQLLGSAIDSLVDQRGWHDEVSVGAVLGRWSEIVGSDVAEHVRVESFIPATADEGAQLVLQADSTAWATQMKLLLPALRRRLDEELGSGVISQVRISGPASPSWRKGAFHVPGRGPRDTYG